MRNIIATIKHRSYLLALLLLLSVEIFSQKAVDQWTWWGGDKTANNKGEYGILGTSHSLNKPGARVAAGNWKDAQGNLWMFGGNGRDSRGDEGYLNDLWKFNIVTHEWTWMGGSNLVTNNTGVFGSKTVEAAGNWPGVRDSRSLSWTDHEGKFWLFGGYRKIGPHEYLNDLWKYDPDTGHWTWMAGEKEPNGTNRFIGMNQSHPDNTPAARVLASGWSDGNGNLWLYGGSRVVQTAGPGTEGYSGDLWKFDINKNKGEWVFVAGSEQRRVLVDYPNNNPGGRHAAITWTDADENLWLFGGNVVYTKDSSGKVGSDLWMYSTIDNKWVYKAGSKLGNFPGDANNPGNREHSCSWNDKNGNLWLFGGLNFDGNRYNDLWRYNTTSGWKIMKGSAVWDQPGNYGTLQVANTANIPGSRSKHIGWTDGEGNLWMFGGTNGGETTSQNFNDLWVYGSFACTPVKGNISVKNRFACFGDSVELTAPNATRYQWFNNGKLISGATGKIYYAKKDGNYNVKLNPGTCEAFSNNTIDVNINTKITIDTAIIRPNCLNPYATVTLTGGGGTSGGYTYSKDNGKSWDTDKVYKELGAGVYYFIVRNSNNCLSDTIKVTIAAISPILVTATGTDIPCSGGNVGSIVTKVTGGARPYRYRLDSGSYSQDSTFSGLAPKTYIVSVEDANNCISLDTVVISQLNNNIKVVSTPNTIPCSGGNIGTISVVASGGSAPYQYKLDSSAFSSQSNFTGLTAGTHIVTVEDANKCSRNDTVVITQLNNTISVTSTPNTIPCSGGNVGTISVVASGGTAPYLYKLGSGSFAAQSTFTGLGPGTHIITVEDANKCSKNDTVTISQLNNNIKITSTPNSIPCSGGNVGTISVAVTGGLAPYQYKIGTGGFTTQSSFSGLGAGSHIITVEDANKCSRNDTVVIAQLNNNISITSTPNTIPCSGGNTGTISVVASGGTAPYLYKLGSGVFGAQSSFTGLGPGTHIVTVEDANKCSKNDTVTISQLNNNIKITSTPNSIPCSGGNVGTISVAVTGGQAPYQYKIGTGGFTTQSSFSGLGAGTHIITVEDANKCSRNDTVTILQTGSAVKAVVGSKTDISCIRASTGSAIITATGGSGKLTYTLGSGAAQDSGTFNGLTGGLYTVTVKDASGCSAQVSFEIVKLAGVGTTISPANPAPVCVGSGVELTAFEAEAYQWTLNDISIPNANTRTYNATKPGNYRVYIRTGSCNILSANTVVISNKECAKAFAQVATAFSPNGNNKNDKLVPIYQNIGKLNRFTVLNRWGQKVFETTVLGEGWDGLYKGEKQPLDTYTWIVDCIDLDGKKIRNSGKTILIR